MCCQLPSSSRNPQLHPVPSASASGHCLGVFLSSASPHAPPTLPGSDLPMNLPCPVTSMSPHCPPTVTPSSGLELSPLPGLGCSLAGLGEAGLPEQPKASSQGRPGPSSERLVCTQVSTSGQGRCVERTGCPHQNLDPLDGVHLPFLQLHSWKKTFLNTRARQLVLSPWWLQRGDLDQQPGGAGWLLLGLGLSLGLPRLA